jgi:hypothetical protein
MQPRVDHSRSGACCRQDMERGSAVVRPRPAGTDARVGFEDIGCRGEDAMQTVETPVRVEASVSGVSHGETPVAVEIPEQKRALQIRWQRGRPGEYSALARHNTTPSHVFGQRRGSQTEHRHASSQANGGVWSQLVSHQSHKTGVLPMQGEPDLVRWGHAAVSSKQPEDIRLDRGGHGSGVVVLMDRIAAVRRPSKPRRAAWPRMATVLWRRAAPISAGVSLP